MRDGEVLQRFTPAAIRVVQYAKEEARRFRGSTVGTEHVLLGLIREQEGVGARVLFRLGVSLGRTQDEIRRQMDLMENRTPGQAQRSWSAGARRVLELALDEARELNPKLGLPNVVDTEHVLLGLIRATDSTAARVLHALGVNLDRLREEVMAQLGSGDQPAPQTGPAEAPTETAPHLVDVNTRIGYDPRTGRATTPEAVKAAGATWGVTRAYVYHADAMLFDTLEGNRATLRVCRQDGFFRPVAVLSPFRGSPLEVAAMAQSEGLRFAFARLFPDQHGFDIDGPAGHLLLALCGQSHLPVMISLPGAGPAKLARALERVSTTVILTGLRYHTLGEALVLGRGYRNVYADISGLATPDGIARLAAVFGPNRLLFGSDYPSLQVGCTALLLQQSGLSGEDQARIRAGNAAALLEARR